MSEFIKMAYEANRVKDVHDAVTEFPPEEEWHQGKIENVNISQCIIIKHKES